MKPAKAITEATISTPLKTPQDTARRVKTGEIASAKENAIGSGKDVIRLDLSALVDSSQANVSCPTETDCGSATQGAKDGNGGWYSSLAASLSRIEALFRVKWPCTDHPGTFPRNWSSGHFPYRVIAAARQASSVAESRRW
jgi:hypothetical protein